MAAVNECPYLAQVRAVVEQLATLDAERTALQAEVELLRHCPGAASSSAAGGAPPAGGLAEAPADPAAQAACRLPADADAAKLQVCNLAQDSETKFRATGFPMLLTL